MAKPAKVIGFDDIARAIREIPSETERQTRATHREIWKEFQSTALVERFNQRAGDISSRRFGYFAVYGMGKYGYAGRQHMTPKRRSSASDQRPAYYKSGAMRSELMTRKPRPKKVGNAIRTEFSIHHRSINLWGSMNGMERIDWRRVPVTYLTTVYTGPGGAADRAGPEKRIVTRNVLQPVVTRSKRTYREEWEFTDAEIAWFSYRSEAVLLSRMRNAVWTKSGKIKTKYASRFAPVGVAA